jgi:DNA-binding transcriptional MerR regulator
MIDRIRIGQLAAQCGVTRDTIRFYERMGLLPKPRRTLTRHRVYDDRSAQQILFIKRSQDLGLTLDDIRQLIELMDSESPMTGMRVAEILRTRLAAIEERIGSFERYRDRLKQVITRTGERSDGHALYQELGIDDHHSLKEA